jgi:hypothetical protein
MKKDPENPTKEKRKEREEKSGREGPNNASFSRHE